MWIVNVDVIRKRRKVMREKRKLRDKMSLKMVIPGDQIEVGNDNEMFSLETLRTCKVNWGLSASGNWRYWLEDTYLKSHWPLYHKNQACNLSFVVKNEGVLKVTGSHVLFKSCSVFKKVLDKDVERTVHKQEVICHTAI